MTWLSRLLTQNPSLHRPASSRSRRSQDRRRKMSLECLESRTVLSNVTVAYDPVTLALTITGDANDDGIRVTELAAADALHPGAVTVAGIVSPMGATTINNVGVTYTSPGPVKTITMNFLSGDVTEFDKVILTGPGKNTPTTVTNVAINVTGQTNLGLSVNNVDNAGTFSLTTNGNINGPGLTPAQINNPTFVSGAATIDNSTFASLSIVQVSPTCTANVELGSDTISGAVNVSLGDGPNDVITLDAATTGVPDVFGSTTLTEGNGTGDLVSVIGTAAARNRLRDLTIRQGNGGRVGNTGAGDVINVQFLNITNPLGPGLTTTQGNGNLDSTTINFVNIPNPSPPVNLPPGFTAFAGISVTQGNGNTDTASVTNSTVPGNITILQGNGNGDTATLAGDHAGAAIFIPGIGFFDVGGNATVTQGNGAGDVVTLNSTTQSGFNVFNNVTITQGNSVNTPAQGSPPLGDTVHVNDTQITSNLTITQGTSSAAAGDYLVTIGDTSPVTVGGFTTITQLGGENVVSLGGAGTGADFVTNWLDINTGPGGGGFVTAMFTIVNIGSVGLWVIDGGGTGNTFFDLGGNSGITVNPSTYNSI